MSEEVFRKKKYMLSRKSEDHMRGEEGSQKGCLLCTIVDRDDLKSLHVTINIHWPCIHDSE